jgi:predicted membrane metal-binding protein
MTVLPHRFLLPDANWKGEQNDGFQFHSLRLFGVLAPLSVMIVGPAFFIIRVLQPGLIPPALAILFFSYAATAAMVAAWIHSDRNSKNVTLWDIAGAFTLMGCTAAIFSEPDQVALLFEQLFERHSDTPR